MPWFHSSSYLRKYLIYPAKTFCMPKSCARRKGLKIWQNEIKNSQPNMLQNSYSDVEMKICSADPNTNHDSMTTMMTVIFVIDVLQQKPGTCHHHFELGGRLPADRPGWSARSRANRAKRVKTCIVNHGIYICTYILYSKNDTNPFYAELARVASPILVAKVWKFCEHISG